MNLKFRLILLNSLLTLFVRIRSNTSNTCKKQLVKSFGMEGNNSPDGKNVFCGKI